MSTKSPEPEVPVRRIDRILAFTALGLAAASIICFFAIIIGTAVGMEQQDFGTGAWPFIAAIPYWGASGRVRHDHRAPHHELHPQGARGIAALRNPS